MSKDPRGTKRHCHSCNDTFYDLGKSPIVCPLCGTAFDPEVLLKSRKARPVVEEAKPEEAPAAAAAAGKEGVGEGVEQEADDGIEEDGLDDGAEVESEGIKVSPDSDDTDEESLVAGTDAVLGEGDGAEDEDDADGGDDDEDGGDGGDSDDDEGDDDDDKGDKGDEDR